jgi:hypothetical protein
VKAATMSAAAMSAAGEGRGRSRHHNCQTGSTDHCNFSHDCFSC